MDTSSLDTLVHQYEILCLDADRTRSIWLTHPQFYSAAELSSMLEETIESIPKPQLASWGQEATETDRFVRSLGEQIHVDPTLLERLTKRGPPGTVTLSTVLDHVIDQLCLTRRFSRLIPTTAVVRYGGEVLVS